jgi:Winged helix DNA-binding domain
VLVDGRVAGTWTVTQDDTAATLRITPLRRLKRQDTDAAVDEGARLLALLADGTARQRVEVVPA